MNDRKKQLKAEYRARTVTGGVFRIRNTETGRYFLHSTDDIAATRNWFAFSVQNGTCTLPRIQEDWKRYGAAAFALEELDLLEKAEDQDDRAFRRDIKTLFELWDEKLQGDERY